MEVTWRQEGWAQPSLRQRVRAHPVAGMHSPACAAAETQPPPQWLYNLKGIPQHTPEDDKSQVFEHIRESRGAQTARMRVCSPFNVVQPHSSGKMGREQSCCAQHRHQALPFLALPWLCCPGWEPALSHRWHTTAQPQHTHTELATFAPLMFIHSFVLCLTRCFSHSLTSFYHLSSKSVV